MTEKDEKRVRKTTVEDETIFKGTLTSQCPVEVLGHLEGEVEAPSLHVRVSGSVAGTVNVKQLISEGSVAGEIEAESVLLSGTVRDKTVIRASSLEVQLAPADGDDAIVFGECELAIGEEPSKEAAVAAALGQGTPAEAAPAEAAPAETAADDGKAAASDGTVVGDAGGDGETAEVSADDGDDDDDDESSDGDNGDGDKKKKGSKRKRARRSSQQPPAG